MGGRWLYTQVEQRAENRPTLYGHDASEQEEAGTLKIVKLACDYHLRDYILLGGPVEQSRWLNAFQERAKTPLLLRWMPNGGWPCA